MLLLAPLATLAALPAPAAAQSEGERINQLIIYGDDECPQSSAEVITVCARKDETERYRIPDILRGNPDSVKNEPWTDRVAAYETVGAQGIASCSPVGPGGASGCLTRLINAAFQERREGGDVRFGQLIEAERQKRLSTIDAEAAATQAHVEQLEREYEAKLARERAAEVAGSGPDAPLPAPTRTKN
jgi:hypothetical protein